MIIFLIYKFTFFFVCNYIIAIAFSKMSSIISLGPDYLLPNVNISCSVVDSGVFEWIWTYEKNALSLSEESYQIFISNDTQSSTLQITNLDLQDSGNYTCSVQSPMDEIKKNMENIVLQLNSKFIRIIM